MRTIQARIEATADVWTDRGKGKKTRPPERGGGLAGGSVLCFVCSASLRADTAVRHPAVYKSKASTTLPFGRHHGHLVWLWTSRDPQSVWICLRRAHCLVRM